MACSLSVLLTSCVEDTAPLIPSDELRGASLSFTLSSDEKNDDPWDSINDKFGQETVHSGRTKSGDDPWDTIKEKFDLEPVVHKSNGEDDPWDTVNDRFGSETVQTGKSKAKSQDPWDTIDQKFPNESVHTGLMQNHRFPRSAAFFVSLSGDQGTAGQASVVEIRGHIALVRFVSGDEFFVVDVPSAWTIETIISVDFHHMEPTKYLPSLTGVRDWKTIP